MDALTIIILMVIVAPLIIIVWWSITLVTLGWRYIAGYIDACIEQKFKTLEGEDEK